MTYVADDGSPLAARARAAHRVEVHAPVEPVWRHRAAVAQRNLAGILGVDPVTILVTPDPARRFGLLRTPEVLLVVFDVPPGHLPPFPSDTQRYGFVPDYDTTSSFLLLAPCPRCRRDVVTYRITTLGDLGRSISGRTAPAPDAAHHAGDPAHQASCPVKVTDPRLGAGYSPP